MISFQNHAFKGMDASLSKLFEHQRAMAADIELMADLLPRGLEVADPATFADAKLIDKRVNEAELLADKMVADIINKFNPMGEELRFILASVKTAGTLERAADKLKNCIKRLAKVNHPLDAQVKADLSRAITAVRAMLPTALAQLVDYQPEAVQQLLQAGAQVQESYKRILIQLHAQVTAAASDATHILLVAKNLEQAADMAIEIMKIGHYVNFGTKYEKQKADA